MVQRFVRMVPSQESIRRKDLYPSESPTPSHLSIKSMDVPLRLGCESPDSGLRSESPTPSHLSMKSMSLPPRLDCESSDSDFRSLGAQALKDPIDSVCGDEMLPTSEDSKYHRKRSRTCLAQDQQEMMTTNDSPLKKSKSIDDTFSLSEVLMSHKTHLKSTFEQIPEGISKDGSPTYVNKIYTDLFITEGECTGVNKEHEVWQIDATLSAQCTEKCSISCNDIFEHRSSRIVLTMGIAGIGKTVLVQKFILDWSDGKANTDLDMIFAIPFRALNLVKDKMFNLCELLLAFYPEFEKLLDMEKHKNCKMLFILDGLDESRLSLNFQEKAMLHSDKQSSTVDMLISSLICGNLLPSARIWITSRKAAVSQIPSKYINLFTEVQGFDDPQKEEYFKKRIDDPIQANKIITHIKASRSLHIMCHIPVFCWISATVLQKILVNEDDNVVPKTLTGMFIYFLLIQTSMKHKKFERNVIEKDCDEFLKTDKEIILQLAELAFKHLQKGNLMFYEDDLTECGIDVNEASVYSGMCTEIFKQEIVLVKEKVYCFVHLSIQEFLAALHIFYSYVFKDVKKLNIFLKGKSAPMRDLTLHEFLKNAMNKALESPNGHLDLFVRFLHGFALESNQKLLKGILPNPTCNSTSTDKVIRNLKRMQRPNISPERCINLLHCLTEMNDTSIQDDIQRLLKSGKGTNKRLSLAECTALAYMLLVSEEVLEEFQLSEYKTTDEGRRRLIPAVRNCRKALLAGCKLTEEAYESVVSALQWPNSSLKELDLGRNDLPDSAVNLLCVSLKSPNCNLEILRLAGCKLSQESCVFLTLALQSPNSHLRELDLSSNNLESSIEEVVYKGLMSKHCRLEVLRVSGCNLTKSSCKVIATFLKQENSHLKELDISHNDLHDAGIELLCPGLQSTHCKVEVLRLSACLISEKGCFCLASVAESHPLLRELDLQCNNPGDAGMELTAKQKDSFCKLELLNINNCSERWLRPGPQKYACHLTLDSNTAQKHISLSKKNLKATYTNKRQHYSDHPDRFIESPMVLCKECLTERHYWEVEWTGNGVRIGATYKGIQRKGRSGLDDSATAWCVECCSERFTFYHANKSETVTRRSGSCSKRVGVYLDWPAGILSFFRVCSDTLERLYTFDNIFAEPLYPGFYVASESEVELQSFDV